MDINVKITAPDLSAAILKLAEVWAQPVEPASASAVAAAAKVAEAARPQGIVAAAAKVAEAARPQGIVAAAAKVAEAARPQGAVAPTPVPTTPAPAPGPAAMPVPTAGPSAATAAGSTPAPAVPVAAAPTYTLEQLSTAGVSLVDAGKLDQLQELLKRYGVLAVTQLQPAQYGAFATDLRALGAQI